MHQDANLSIVRYRTISYDIVAKMHKDARLRIVRYRTISYDIVQNRTISYDIVRYRTIFAATYPGFGHAEWKVRKRPKVPFSALPRPILAVFGGISGTTYPLY